VFHGHKLKRMRWASMIVATAVEETSDQIQNPQHALAPQATPQTLPQIITKEVAMLQLEDFQVFSRSDFDSDCDRSQPTSSIAIMIDSAEDPILVNLTQRTFDHVHHIVNNAESILWITAESEGSDNPARGAVKGFARCIRSENPLKRFSTLFMTTSSFSDQDKEHQTIIVRQALKHLLQTSALSDIEPEMYEIDTRIHIPRISPRPDQDRRISDYVSGSAERTVKFADHKLKLSIRSPGLLDSLYYSEVKASEVDEPLAVDEIKVDIQAVGVNFKDCLVALGRVDDTTFGTECAGIVSEVGANCTLKQGDKVIVCHLDTFRREVRCKEALAVKIPENLSMIEAAKVATNFVTAWHALIYIGRLSKGESILIHAAAGGTGQAAVQIAQHVGAEIFATVSSQEKRDILTKRYCIPDDHILYSRDTSFAEGIQRLTTGHGVDVVLNSLAGEQLIASFECMAPYGRFLEIGKADILSHGNLPMFPFLRNVSFAAIDLAAMTTEKPMLVNQALREVVALFTKGALKISYPLKTFQVDQVEESFRYLQGGQNAGVVAVEINPLTEVQVSFTESSDFPGLTQMNQAVVNRQEKADFDPNATYVVAGGLGGQGKSIVRWMLRKHARNFVLLSRSGCNSEEAKAFVDELEQAGAKVIAPKCDISSSDSLAECLKYAEAQLPPIKGCIQAAMVMNVSVFL
jgi:NADPH:quinone reductase-like Zn-dependent oxidoreductase